MRYRIEHVTRYAYSQPVGLSLQVGHLRPRDSAEQRCLSHALSVSPEPDYLFEDRDYFGNPVTRFELIKPHQSLQIVASSEVEVQRKGERPSEVPSWEAVSAHFASTRWGLDEDSRAGEFLFPSLYVPHSQAMREYAAESFGEDRSVIDATRDLMGRIHADFDFDPSATHIATPVETVLKMRRGVCQDFAHLMIACLRALGLPARYMSGYLLTQPPPGKPRMIGADASHAWVALYVPEHGWFEFDPTNDVMPGEAHITLGWGRDFADVSPLRGVIHGGGEHDVAVGVTVTPLGETKEAAEPSRPAKPEAA
ncbi:transglutaminase family protein [Uliginosibacterium sediminicola]|uniref:Transglutaminase family protein n=1 Tax=Uliginosibacterium sediminicola TaxID=2024550 RepID=A0ABU9YXY7_9RHOO